MPEISNFPIFSDGSCHEEYKTCNSFSAMPDPFAPIVDMDSIFDEEKDICPSSHAVLNDGGNKTLVTSLLFANSLSKLESGRMLQRADERIDPVEILSDALATLQENSSDPFEQEIDAQISSDVYKEIDEFFGSSVNTEQIMNSGLRKRQNPASESVIEDVLFPEAKRRRQCEDGDSDSFGEVGVKFRFYQAEKWLTKFQQLIDYKNKHGHCQVPHGYKPNPTLARWAKRQRYQYKLFQENKPSTMTQDRIDSLEKLGFVWDSHTALWEERYKELQDYCRVFGHTNVPSTYPPNPKLAIWVKCQRRQYKLLCANKQSNMTIPRVQLLNNLNFVWEVRRTG